MSQVLASQALDLGMDGEAAAEVAPAAASASVKTAAPFLSTRASRPPAVRLRGLPVKLAGAAAVTVLTGAFVWAFVISPRLHAISMATAKGQAPAVTGSARPSERITSQPASYDQPTAAANAGTTPTPDALGPPRSGPDAVAGGTGPAGTTVAAPSASSSSPAPSPAVTAAQDARRSGLFFTGLAGNSPQPAHGPMSSSPTDISAPGPVGASPVSAQALADYDAVYGRHVLIAPRSPYEVKAGTLIPAALLTTVDTGRPGPVVAVVTEPVFDTVTGRTLLIPQGARLIGAQAGDSTYGEKRAFLVWKRIILPDGKSLILEDQAAVDAEGTTGVPGYAERRWPQLAGAILASGAITTLGELAQNTDTNRSPSILGGVGDASAVQAVQVGGRLVDRELNVQPKVVVRAGATVQVLLTKDLVLEPPS